MARRKAAANSISQEIESNVQHVTFKDSTNLVTLDWPQAKNSKLPIRLKGAIVRVRVVDPSVLGEGWKVLFDEFIGSIRGIARKVTVLPYREKEIISKKEMARIVSASARDVVTHLVDSSTSTQKKRLTAVTEQVMGEIGL